MKELLHTEAADGILKLHYKDYLHYCRVTTATPGRGVVTEHMIIYVNSGELELTTQGRTYHLRKGDAYMLRRNHLCQKQARPLPGNEPFEGIFFYLTVPMLRRAMSQNGISLRGAKPWTRSSAYIALPRSPFLENLFASLLACFKAGQFPGERLMELKMQETVLTLIETAPWLRSLLFDFATPLKPDLHAFMEQYYLQDLDLSGLAHYAGRSLAAFKNDFARTFQTSPGRWIVSRRLEEAKRRMEELGERPAEVYRAVGFKTLSHFSRAFKRQFGVAPSYMGQ